MNTVHECDRRTDGQTDRQTDRITITKTVQRIASHGKKVKMDTCYSALLDTRNKQRDATSEVAADWHELTIPRRIVRPSIARDIAKTGPTVQHKIYRRPNQPYWAFTSIARKLLLISRQSEGSQREGQWRIQTGPRGHGHRPLNLLSS